MKLPAGMTLNDTIALSGGFQKLKAVNFSTDIHERYTFWSGLLGGTFLMLSYFGTDQSQVQRYIGGASLREGRLGLMFNAVCKIPMQFFILLLGVMLFVFYQFERPPVFFNHAAWSLAIRHDGGQRLQSIEQDFTAVHDQKQQFIKQWLDAKRTGDGNAETEARSLALAANDRSDAIRADARKAMRLARSLD